jgi:hypothetical protein
VEESNGEGGTAAKGKGNAAQLPAPASDEDEDPSDLGQDEHLPEDQRQEKAMTSFRKHYPDLATDREIWFAYNYDTAELDMTKECVCDVVRHAYSETCDNSGGQGPPNKVLRSAMTQKRRDSKALNCRTTKAWINWCGSESSGAKHEEVLPIDYSLGKRFKDVRTGCIAPVRDRFEGFRYNVLPAKETEELSAIMERSLKAFYERKRRNSILHS